MVWHVLDVGSIWMREFASELSKIESTVCWQPTMLATGAVQSWSKTKHQADPPLDFVEFPLQRGYARVGLRTVLPFDRKLFLQLSTHTPESSNAVLLCTTPFYVPVAERWRGPVVYYATDLVSSYGGVNSSQVKRLERRMCKTAQLVCPNSRRIAQHLEGAAQCEPQKIVIIPNATRSCNVSPRPRFHPDPPPDEIADMPRPFAGVIGDLSANMDWLLLADTIRRTPQFSWIFVGPTKRPIVNNVQSEAREWVKRHARFVGFKPYGELQAYARCLDVAILPYYKDEPTYSGSSTRFYEHLAALRPMIATRGFAELLEKEPLLRLVDTAGEMAQELIELKSLNFCDSHECIRWEASRTATWHDRARTISESLAVSLSNEKS